MRLSTTTIIDAPTSFVFQMLLDIDLATRWVPTLVSYSLISGPPNKVGSTYRSEFNYNGFEYEQMAEITAYVENQSVEWSATTPFCDAEVAYFLTQISDNQTEFEHIHECHYKGLSKIWAWLAKSKVRKKSEEVLTETHGNFKALVEAKYWASD